MTHNSGIPYENVLTAWGAGRFVLQKALHHQALQALAKAKSLKLPDFVLRDTAGTIVALLDAKGRSTLWENYLDAQQLRDFVQWTDSYRVGLVWVYSDHHTAQCPPFERIEVDGYRYVLGCADVLKYSPCVKVRSKKWDTVSAPRQSLRLIMQTLTSFVV